MSERGKTRDDSLMTETAPILPCVARQQLRRIPSRNAAGSWWYLYVPARSGTFHAGIYPNIGPQAHNTPPWRNLKLMHEHEVGNMKEGCDSASAVSVHPPKHDPTFGNINASRLRSSQSCRMSLCLSCHWRGCLHVIGWAQVVCGFVP